ncbi:glycosyl transferase family 2 [Candidatus Magnetoovum chiemensis]|nr:glycosyl transferase family 2 [Candidatus Magnetoovum chiemensis]
MNRVSVVVPVYNGEQHIRQCLDALVSQSFGKNDYEIIVADDGSTDNTPAIVKSYSVKYIRQENRGPASARNLGVRNALGEIILFTDADCAPSNNWVQEMLRPLLSDSDNIAAVKGVYRTSQTSKTARFAQAEFEERYEMLKKHKFIDMVDTYSAAFKKEIFLKVGGFDESFPEANNEDTELSYKLSLAGYKMVFNPNAVVSHLKHPDTLVKYARQKFWRGFWRMAVYKRFPQKMVKDTYTPQSLKVQIMLILSGLFLTLPVVTLPFALLVFLGFLATTVRFSRRTYKKDREIGIRSPFYLAVRALSIGLGVMYFLVKK